VGDIDEEYFERVLSTSDIAAARRWYWGQVFHSIKSRTQRTRVPRGEPIVKGENLMRTTWMDLRYALRGCDTHSGVYGNLRVSPS
jgi:hypothetical protein